MAVKGGSAVDKKKQAARVERAVEVKACKLHPNPWNPYAKKSDRLKEAIAESINEFTQIQDIVVRPHPDLEGEYQILDGEGRRQTFSDEETVYVTIVHGLTDGQAKKVTLVMDETRATADKIELSQLLAELAGDDSIESLISGLPYTEAGLEDLIQLAEVDWDNFDAEENTSLGDESDDDSKEGWKSVYVRCPDSVFDLLTQARGLVSDQMDLHKTPEIAWGQVIEVLVGEYLAIPR
jgi:hypothetical protein